MTTPQRQREKADPDPNEIVGHKTFDTGERGEYRFPVYRHEPLTRAEADAIWKEVEKAKKHRAEKMPDDRAALLAMHEAFTRLKELGWQEAMYCPKDGSEFDAIEAGSTGIHNCNYIGEWATGYFQLFDGHDVWPSHPILFRKREPKP